MNRRYPASFVQQRSWEIDRDAPGAPFYNHALCLRLRGEIDRELARECIAAAFERHEILRTRIGPGADGGLVQEVLPPPSSTVEIKEVRNEFGDNNSNLTQYVSALAARPLPLDGPPALRTALYALPRGDFVFLLASHPCLLDNTSTRLLQRELSLSYAQLSLGGPVRVPRPYLQYGEFAYWQRKWFDEERRRRYAAFWPRYLRGASLSAFPEWPDSRKPFAPRKMSSSFGPLAKRAVSNTAGEFSVGPAAIFLTAYCAAILRCVSDTVFPVGVLIANRGRPEIQRTLGNFANSVVVLVGPNRQATWPQRVRAVHGELMKVLPYADLPLDVSIGRSKMGRPAYAIQFSYEEEFAHDVDSENISPEMLDLEVGHSKFLLSLRITGSQDDLRASLIYDATAISETVAGSVVRELAINVAEITSRICGFTAER